MAWETEDHQPDRAAGRTAVDEREEDIEREQERDEQEEEIEREKEIKNYVRDRMMVNDVKTDWQ